MFGRTEEKSVLFELGPSPIDDEAVTRARAAFAGLSGAHSFSVEFAATGTGLRFYLRVPSTAGTEAVLGQLRSAYPQAAIEPVPEAARPHLDPLAMAPHEAMAAVDLVPLRDCAFPLDSDARRGEPLSGVLAAAVGERRPGDRVIGQLRLVGGASERRLTSVRARAAREHEYRRFTPDRTAPGSLLPLALAGGLGALALQLRDWYANGELVPLAGSREPLAAALAEEKLAFPLFAVRLRVITIGQQGEERRLQDLARRIAGAYRAFDHPAGNGLRPRRARKLGRHRHQAVLNAAELAALWHLPSDPCGLPVSARTGGRRIVPAQDTVSRGCRIGISSHQGQSVPARLPHTALFRNHLVVAKTRRGKSTLLQHLAAHLMQQIDSGRERLLLVVIDPHQDLAESVLSVVPPGLEERTAYLDLTNRERPAGLNLLDVALFPSRDRTAENVIAMLHRLWPDNWGPRMEGALRAALLCLHEANQRRRREEQYTMLDVVPLLSGPEFRERVMSQVADETLWAWWHDNYNRLGRAFQQQIANPVTTKVGRFQVTEAARLTVGQARSTINPRELLQDGGVLVVNSAVGLLGEGGAALIGATVLNLLSLVVEEQIALPPAQRSRLVALIDESSTLAGADYPRMMSELGKYGASFVLVTQSLAKLDAIDRALRPTIFANIDSLTVFQVSAEDARYLAPELGAALDAAERRGLPVLDLLLAEAPPASSDLLRLPIWKVPGRSGRVSLEARLTWRLPSPGAMASSNRGPIGEPPPVNSPPRLYDWAKHVTNGKPAGTSPVRGRPEQLAALSIMTTAEQKLLLQHAGRLPLLTETELRLVLGLPRLLMRRILDRSLRQGLIKMLPSPLPAGRDAEARYVLTEQGLRLLAARAGVPFRRFAEHCQMAAALPGAYGSRLRTLVRQFEHTVGANSFFVTCLRRSTAGGPRLVGWQSALEAAIRFESGGVRRWVRPDGAGEVVFDGARHRFFLEWDRGTERIGVLMEKLDGYAAYCRALAAAGSELPQLLVVTTTPQREDVIWKAADVALSLHVGRAVTTVESLAARLGPFGVVWRDGNPGRRRLWMRPRRRPEAECPP